jgi:uncharacterized membrane protein (DUF2068 family)
MNTSDNRLIRLIALFKLLKAVLLIAIGVGAFKLLHKDLAIVLADWVNMLGLHADNHFVDHALRKAASLPPDKIRDVGIGSFIYAGLFLTEGIGLWMVKRWAEWFTIILTSTLIPLEVYEIFRHPTLTKLLVFLLNVGVVVYLIYRVRAERRISQP